MQTDDIAQKLLGVPFDSLDARSQKVMRHVAERTHIAGDAAREGEAAGTFGQRAADAVARFGGSWTFIGIFAATLIMWVGLNSFLLVRYDEAFDPFPFILLNLFLSMLASVQAPIILMSQNRQGEKDRMTAASDYEINLKAELEIMLLHQKVDMLREGQWAELLAVQNEQLKLLKELLEHKNAVN